MIIHTTYTLLGYTTTLDDDEVVSGGNHPMSSTGILMPSEGPRDLRPVMPLTIGEIKELAKLAHTEALATYKAVDGGIKKDVDLQNDQLALLGITSGMTAGYRAEYKALQRVASIQKQVLANLWRFIPDLKPAYKWNRT